MVAHPTVPSVIRLFVTTVLLLVGALFPALAAPPAGQTWNLVWSDEFTNGTSLDTNLWGSGSTPWGSENQSSCTLIPPEDTYVTNGTLINRSRSGSFTGPSGTVYPYTSGWTWSKVWLTYGYLEIRAQYPNEAGAWPAWWMLQSGWPPEIDIAEYRGNPPNPYMTEAFYNNDDVWNSTTIADTGGSYAGWHVYGLEWGPGYVEYYIDGVLQHTDNDPLVPSSPMYVILSNGSDCSTSGTNGFPNYFVVDYFRWYQVPPTNVPVTPASLTATGGSNQVALSWSAMDRAASYNVKRAVVSGGPYATIATTTGLTATRYSDTNVVNFTSYYYVVSAVNAIGQSTNSAEVSATPTPPPISTGDPVIASTFQSPNYPTNGNDGNFTTRWTASSGNFPQWWRVDLGLVQTIRKVAINWEETSAFHQYTIDVSSNDSTYATVVNQTNNTTVGNTADAFTATGRYVRVTVTGASSGWASFFECQVFGGTPPGPPSGLSATATSANQINLSWSAGSGATEYNLKRATVSGGPFVSVAGPASTNYSDTGLTGGATYYYVVSAVNGGGESTNSAQASATTPSALPAPTGLNATAISTNQINLNWTASSGASSYNVKSASVRGGPYTAVATGVTAITYTNAGLSSGTTYYYVVTAVNTNGESANSLQASATTTPPAPASLTVTAGNMQLTLDWGATLGAASYNVKQGTVSGGPYTNIATGITAFSFTSTGLRNGTNYFYVVSAVNAAGESVNSTEVSATPIDIPVLVSQGQPASASSFQSGNVVANGNDGSLSTRWTAASGAFPQWWQVDLGSVQSLSQVVIIWESASAYYQYAIAVSSDATNYATVVNATNNTTIGYSTNNFTASARYVRVTVTGASPGEWASFYEFQVFGYPVSTVPPQMAIQLTSTELTITWPPANTGWQLQTQTNGLGTNWTDVPGSPATNQMGLAISHAKGAVFYRLIYP